MSGRCAIAPVLLILLIPFVSGSEVLRVGVSVLPLEPLVKAVGGDAVEVRSLQREGDSCSVFEPRPSAINWLAEAQLFFRIGAGYESVILDKVESRFPNLKVDDLRETVETIPLVDHATHDHDHAHVCAHCAEDALSATDPHIWLDPVRLGLMAVRVAERLGEALPEKSPEFSRAAEEFSARMTAVHEELEAELAPFRGRAFYIYHPALGYFAGRYGLQQVSIAGSSQGPTAKELHRLIGQARRDGVKTLFVQPQESKRHAEIVAGAIGARLVEVDPMSMELEMNLIGIGKALSDSFIKD